MKINNIYAYLNKECNDIEYLTHTQLGDQSGKITKHKVYNRKFRSQYLDNITHYFYVVKKEKQIDYKGRKYDEFKILDLDEKTGSINVLYKDRIYHASVNNRDFWNEAKNYTAVKDKIYYYIDVNSDYE